MKNFDVGFNALTSLNNLQRTSNTRAVNKTSIDIPLKKGIKLSSNTLESLTNPAPGSFMGELNKLTGFIDLNG